MKWRKSRTKCCPMTSWICSVLSAKGSWSLMVRDSSADEIQSRSLWISSLSASNDARLAWIFWPCCWAHVWTWAGGADFPFKFCPTKAFLLLFQNNFFFLNIYIFAIWCRYTPPRNEFWWHWSRTWEWLWSLGDRRPRSAHPDSECSATPLPDFAKLPSIPFEGAKKNNILSNSTPCVLSPCLRSTETTWIHSLHVYYKISFPLTFWTGLSLSSHPTCLTTRSKVRLLVVLQQTPTYDLRWSRLAGWNRGVTRHTLLTLCCLWKALRVSSSSGITPYFRTLSASARRSMKEWTRPSNFSAWEQKIARVIWPTTHPKTHPAVHPSSRPSIIHPPAEAQPRACPACWLTVCTRPPSGTPVHPSAPGASGHQPYCCGSGPSQTSSGSECIRHASLVPSGKPSRAKK